MIKTMEQSLLHETARRNSIFAETMAPLHYLELQFRSTEQAVSQANVPKFCLTSAILFLLIKCTFFHFTYVVFALHRPLPIHFPTCRAI